MSRGLGVCIRDRCSIDYDKNSPITRDFYAMVQNKFHYAITGQTAAEIIYNSADHEKDHMGLKTWKNSPDGRILKSDVSVAKNYLDDAQIKKLERTVSGYFDYVEDLIKVHGLDDTHIGKGTQLFLDAAEELGLNPIKMPKAIYEEKCIQCGQCAFGCPVDAKWTGKHFVDIAIENGAEFIDEAEITDLITEDNRIKGVKFIKNGKEEILNSDTVVLSAGAIGSALILRKIGIDAGRELFFDPFVSVGGVIKDINFNTEVQMAGLVAGKNFVLSPHYSSFIPSKIGGDAEPKDILLSLIHI